jgi:hypothetical protein
VSRNDHSWARIDRGAERQIIDAGTKRLVMHWNAAGDEIVKDRTMKKYLGISAALAASVAVTGCATTPYGNNGYNDPYYSGQNANTRNAATGAVGGAVAGGVLGAIVPGVSTVEGAVAGAVLGGVLGAVVKGRQYYRDTRGYCYYVDQYGRPIYDYNTRC